MKSYDEYKAVWAKKTRRQIEKEIDSMRKYMQKHDAAYKLHSGEMTAPGELADGVRLMALREVLEEMQ